MTLFYNTDFWEFIHYRNRTNEFIKNQLIINSHEIIDVTPHISKTSRERGFINYRCKKCKSSSRDILYYYNNDINMLITCEELMIKKLLE